MLFSPMLYVTISYVWDLTCATSTCWEVHIPELPPKWKSIYLQIGICCADINQLSSIISEQTLNWITPGSPKPSYHGWVRWVVNLEKTIGFYSSNMKGEMGVGRKQNKTPPPKKKPQCSILITSARMTLAFQRITEAGIPPPPEILIVPEWREFRYQN